VRRLDDLGLPDFGPVSPDKFAAQPDDEYLARVKGALAAEAPGSEPFQLYTLQLDLCT
jgi:hypothetical protein